MNKINFENLPSTNTPINAENLNAMQNNIENAINNILQSGTTNNVNYIKYIDGTLIQYGKVTLQSYTGRSSGGLTYWSQATTITLPVSFLNVNYSVTTNVNLANMNNFAQSYGAIEGVNQVKISFVSTADEDNRNIDFICIGRWK